MARTRKNNRWSIPPQKLARALKIKVAEVPRVVVLEMGTRIIKRSPVGHPDFKEPALRARSGNFRVNWRYGQGLQSPHYDPSAGSGEPLGVAPAETIAGLTASVGAWRMGTSYAILNASPYGGVLEYGGYPAAPARGSYNYRTKQWEILSAGGFSKQAPAGMVRVTIGEFQNIVSAAAKRERAKGLRV